MAAIDKLESDRRTHTHTYTTANIDVCVWHDVNETLMLLFVCVRVCVRVCVCVWVALV